MLQFRDELDDEQSVRIHRLAQRIAPLRKPPSFLLRSGRIRLRKACASVRLPIAFITGHGYIPMAVRAMKASAIEFLTTPFRDQELLDVVNDGLARDRTRREDEEALGALKARFEELTPRERAILLQVVEGWLNKQIAGEMGITETTLKVHRSNMMRKINAASVAELCRTVDKLKLLPENSRRS